MEPSDDGFGIAAVGFKLPSQTERLQTVALRLQIDQKPCIIRSLGPKPESMSPRSLRVAPQMKWLFA